MDAVYFVIGTFVIGVAFFNRELLVMTSSFRAILTISIILFLAGLVIHYIERGNRSANGALLVPLISLGLYRLCRWYFVKKFNREPRDTFMDWTPGMDEDRFFNIVYFTSAMGIAIFLTGFIGRLGEAGW